MTANKNARKLKGGLAMVFGGRAAIEEKSTLLDQPKEETTPATAVENTPGAPEPANKTDKIKTAKPKPRKPARGSQTIKTGTNKKTVDTKKSEPKGEGRVAAGKQKEKAVVVAPDQPAKPEKEVTRPFHLLLPESLDKRLRFYEENYARRHESKTRLILAAIDKHLTELEIAAGITEKGRQA